MNNFWKLNIDLKALDGFLYMGKLFVLLSDSTLRYINLDKFCQEELSSISSNKTFANRIFFNNHFIPGRSHKYFNYWRSQWRQLATASIDIQLKADHLPVLCEVGSPVLDLKVYAQKLILATRNGVLEAPIDFSAENETHLITPLRTVIDAKGTYLSAKAGEVFISSPEGLFRASFWNSEGKLIAHEKEIERTSLKTNWRSYDLLNFEESNRFKFFYNEVEKVTSDTVGLLADDGEKELKKISEFGVHQFDSSSFFSDMTNNEEILFSFNSNTYIFIIFKDGTFSTFSIENEAYEMPRASIQFNLPRFENIKELGKPINALTVPKGTLVEFFDQVLLVKRGEIEPIENSPVCSMRTYPNSKWYKNLITTFKETSLTITALNPFE